MNKITLLDGATGTRLWALAEAVGAEKVSTWRYNIEHPEFVVQAVREYIEAGSQIILTNTFSANAPEIEGACAYSVAEVVRAAVRAAKTAAAGTGVKTALDIGPLSELLEPYGDLAPERAAEIFDQQMSAGTEAGAELIFIETFMDLEMMKVAASQALKYDLPVFCSMSFTKAGRTMFGDSVQDVIDALEPMGAAALGLNCSLGPELAMPIIREFAGRTTLPLIFKPNAGMPVTGFDGSAFYPCGAEQFSGESAAAFDCASYIGGCCGIDASYIRALKARLLRE